jgi:AcrR family transcriptional regulator
LNKSQIPRRDRRAELLAIGRRLFAARPYDALSIDELAAEAGVAKGLLYYYFGSKRGYYLAVVEDAASELRGLASPDPGLPPAERLRRTLDAYIAFAGRHPEAYRALTHAGVGADGEVRAVHDRERAVLLELIAAETVGMPPPAAARTMLEGWLSLVEGATLDWLEHRDLEPAQVRELLVGALAGAMAAAAAVDPGLELDFSPFGVESRP